MLVLVFCFNQIDFCNEKRWWILFEISLDWISSGEKSGVSVDVKDLAVYFHIEQGIVKAVDGVNFQIEKGKSLGVVGESGCGKTITALSLMLLHPQPEGQIERGNIYFYSDDEEPIDIAKLGIHSKQIRKRRGNDIAMIFQEPMMSLNPVHNSFGCYH